MSAKKYSEEQILEMWSDLSENEVMCIVFDDCIMGLNTLCVTKELKLTIDHTGLVQSLEAPRRPIGWDTLVVHKDDEELLRVDLKYINLIRVETKESLKKLLMDIGEMEFVMESSILNEVS